jgi:hypothetical protein
MPSGTILTPTHALTMKMLGVAKKNAPERIKFASKVACTAARNELRSKTKKRYSGTLRESYAVRLSKTGGTEHYEVYTSEVRQSKISNRKKFRLYDLGRKGIKAKGKKKLYIPMNQKGYDAYTRGSIAGLKSMKRGIDYVWAKAVKPAKGRKILQFGQRVGVRRFKERINFVLGKQLLRTR